MHFQGRKDLLPEFELLYMRQAEKKLAKSSRRERNPTSPVSVAYIDVRMSPGIDGIETVRRVRKIDSDVELVIMTTDTEQAMPENIRKMGLLRRLLYIRKPFTREEIQQMTIYLVEKWNVERQLVEKLEQLNTYNQKLKATLDAIENPIAMWDPSARIVFANQRYEKLFDLSENALKKTSPERFVARYKKRFRELKLTDEKEGSLFPDAGNMVEETTTAQGFEATSVLSIHPPRHRWSGRGVRRCLRLSRIAQRDPDRTHEKQSTTLARRIGKQPPLR